MIAKKKNYHKLPVHQKFMRQAVEKRIFLLLNEKIFFFYFCLNNNVSGHWEKKYLFTTSNIF